MFGSRRGRANLIGAAARTAGCTSIVVGSANAMTRSRDSGAGEAPPTEAPLAEIAPVAAAAAAGGLTDDGIARLKQVAELHAAGLLTDAKFAEQKTRILAG